ncbi:MAG: zinc finger domain-containing protein, partial [Chthoniobacterales bacterium]
NPAWHSEETIRDVEELLKLRGVVSQEIDAAKKSGVFSNTLEARVRLRSGDTRATELLTKYASELEELFILSDLVSEKGEGLSAEVDKTDHVKCDRCWRHRKDVGVDAEHPLLCGRCAEAVHASES